MAGLQVTRTEASPRHMVTPENIAYEYLCLPEANGLVGSTYLRTLPTYLFGSFPQRSDISQMLVRSPRGQTSGVALRGLLGSVGKLLACLLRLKLLPRQPPVVT